MHTVTIKVVGSKTTKVVEVPEWCNLILNFIQFLKEHLKTSNEIEIFLAFSQSCARVYKNNETLENLLNDAQGKNHVNVLIRKPKAHGLQIKDLTNNGGHHVVYDGASREISNNPTAGDSSIELPCGIKVKIPAGSIEGKVTIQAVGSTDPRFRGSILDFSTNNK